MIPVNIQIVCSISLLELVCTVLNLVASGSNFQRHENWYEEIRLCLGKVIRHLKIPINILHVHPCRGKMKKVKQINSQVTNYSIICLQAFWTKSYTSLPSLKLQGSGLDELSSHSWSPQSVQNRPFMADDPRACSNTLHAAGFAQILPKLCTPGICKNFFLAMLISGFFIYCWLVITVRYTLRMGYCSWLTWMH